MNQWKVNVPNTIVVDLGLSDIYGASGFSLWTKYADETVPTRQDVEFVEIVEDLQSELTISADADAPRGSYEIVIGDTSGIEVGMRFLIGEGDGKSGVDTPKGIVYVSKVTTNSIVVRKALEFDVVAGDILQQVGNTGVYEAQFTPTKLGPLTFVIANPSIGLQNEVAKVQVVSDYVDDVAADVASAYNDLSAKLSDIQNALGTAGAQIVRGRIFV